MSFKFMITVMALTIAAALIRELVMRYKKRRLSRKNKVVSNVHTFSKN